MHGRERRSKPRAQAKAEARGRGPSSVHQPSSRLISKSAFAFLSSINQNQACSLHKRHQSKTTTSPHTTTPHANTSAYPTPSTQTRVARLNGSVEVDDAHLQDQTSLSKGVTGSYDPKVTVVQPRHTVRPTTPLPQSPSQPKNPPRHHCLHFQSPHSQSASQRAHRNSERSADTDTFPWNPSVLVCVCRPAIPFPR